MSRRRGSRRLLSAFLSAGIAAVVGPATALVQPITATAAAGCNANAILAGGFVSGAISNGQLFMWGTNSDGQLGIGSIGPAHASPTAVASTTGLTFSSAAETNGASTFSVDGAEMVWGWGTNHSGQIANPNVNQLFPNPVQISGPNSVVSVAAGGVATLAAASDGSVWGWGSSPDGELGVVRTTPQITPAKIAGLSNISAVAGATEGFDSFALRLDGTVLAAGRNDFGELGLGSGATASPTFQPVPGLSGVLEIAPGEGGFADAFTVALDQNHNVFVTGSNVSGQSGNGSASNTPQLSFTLVRNLGNVDHIAAGLDHVLVLKFDGTVWAWGSNAQGQLGDGTFNDSARPVQVTFPSGVKIVAIAAGFSHSMALDASGNIWSWGSNSLGELGTGTAGGFKGSPVLVGACTAPTQGYQPTVNGYTFGNTGVSSGPSYARMANFYPSSRNEMYFTVPILNQTIPTGRGALFYESVFLPFYVGYPLLGGGGLCFGMSASNQFLFNQFPSKSANAAFPSLSSKFTDSWGPSPRPDDVTIEDFIERYHSRQLSESAAVAAIDSWNTTEDTGGNLAAMSRIQSITKTGKTVWVGIGPRRSLLQSPNPLDQLKFLQLFNSSHAVLAYFVDSSSNKIMVYDPNDPNGNQAHFQLVADGRPGDGIQLVSSHGTVSYGNGKDLGNPDDWTLMPLPDTAFTDAGMISGLDNTHWILDLGGVAWMKAASDPTLNGTPIFRILGASSPNVTGELLPGGTGLNDVVQADTTGSQTTQLTSTGGAQVTQTDATATGTSHRVQISPDSTQLTLSGASANEQFDAMLVGDVLAASYGRRVTLTGATLAPGATLNVGVDPAFASVSLSVSGPDELAGLQLEQIGVGSGAAGVDVTIPGNGAQGNVVVADWSGLASTLIFEAITAADGTVTVLLLQDNPGQRLAFEQSLLQSVGSSIGQIADQGIQASLQSKLDNASRQLDHNPVAAANMLQAMRNEIAAQRGKGVDPSLADSLDHSLQEAIGLVQASV